MLLKNKIKIGAAIGASLLTFTAIGTSVGVIESQKTNTQINNNVKTSVIKNDNLNNQSTNYSNYLKDTTLTQVENLIDQKVNQQTAMFATLSSNQTKILQYQQELKIQTNEIVRNIFSKKLSVNDLLNEINKKYNNLTPNQKNFIQSKINYLKKNNKKPNNLRLKNLSLLNFNVFVSSSYYYQNVDESAAEQFQSGQKKFLQELLGFAGFSTAAAIATTAVAAAEWCIPFWGWVAAGFTTAAATADWVATGLSWSAYKELDNLFITIAGFLDAGASTGVVVAGDLPGLVNNVSKYRNTLLNKMSGVRDSADADLAANDADIWADPYDGVVAITIDVFVSALDIAMVGVGIAGSILSM